MRGRPAGSQWSGSEGGRQGGIDRRRPSTPRRGPPPAGTVVAPLLSRMTTAAPSWPDATGIDVCSILDALTLRMTTSRQHQLAAA